MRDFLLKLARTSCLLFAVCCQQVKLVSIELKIFPFERWKNVKQTAPAQHNCFHLIWLRIEHQYDCSKYISNVFDSSSVALSIYNVNIAKKERLIFFIYNHLNLFFIILHEILYTNLSIHFKKCQNFQTKNKLKELILAKISPIPQISHVD